MNVPRLRASFAPKTPLPPTLQSRLAALGPFSPNTRVGGTPHRVGKLLPRDPNSGYQRGLRPGFAAASPRARSGSGTRAPAPGAAPAERDGAARGAETPPSPAQPRSPLPKTPALLAGAPPPGTSRGERGGLRAPGGLVSPLGPASLTRGRSCSWGSAAARCSRGNGAACARRCGL